jgi:hypothetical protein
MSQTAIRKVQSTCRFRDGVESAHGSDSAVVGHQSQVRNARWIARVYLRMQQTYRIPNSSSYSGSNR